LSPVSSDIYDIIFVFASRSPPPPRSLNSAVAQAMRNPAITVTRR
jgi:hypothetical protein